ncbi:MAG: class I SAM-dependent methyltransferase [Pseudomonadota bacterium]
MHTTQPADAQQAALWNGPAGSAWVEAQDVLERMFAPFEQLLAEAIPPGPGTKVLDVGCGTGSTTLAAARRLGAQGAATGIDISQPMLATARARAGREGIAASFVCADAQVHAFPPAEFDVLISRFGVMFFADPVGAFANLRRAAKAGAALRFAAWRGPGENPFMTTAERAAAPLLPDLPARRPDGPGQFAFADPRRVQDILERSGWTGVGIRPIDVACAFPAAELVRYLSLLGPVGLFLREADAQTRAQVIDVVRAAFDPYVHGGEVRYTAACWMVDARAPSR